MKELIDLDVALSADGAAEVKMLSETVREVMRPSGRLVVAPPTYKVRQPNGKVTTRVETPGGKLIPVKSKTVAYVQSPSGKLVVAPPRPRVSVKQPNGKTITEVYNSKGTSTLSSIFSSLLIAPLLPARFFSPGTD